MEARFYAVRDNARNVVSDYFAKKMDAKKVRNEMMENGRSVYVTKGPDHPLFTEALKPNAVKRRKTRKR